MAKGGRREQGCPRPLDERWTRRLRGPTSSSPGRSCTPLSTHFLCHKMQRLSLACPVRQPLSTCVAKHLNTANVTGEQSLPCELTLIILHIQTCVASGYPTGRTESPSISPSISPLRECSEISSLSGWPSGLLWDGRRASVPGKPRLETQDFSTAGLCPIARTPSLLDLQMKRILVRYTAASSNPPVLSSPSQMV